MMDTAGQVKTRKGGMRRILLISNALNGPLFSIYPLVGLILYKDLGASAFQVVLLTTLKPVVTVLSFYWGSGLKGRGHKLKSNVIWAGIWMRLPFLLCPFFDSAWFIILASINYMFFFRAASPAWLEMLKRTLGEKKRAKVFSQSSALGYLEGVVLSIGMGAILDKNPESWKILFPISALVGLITVFIQSRIQIDSNEQAGDMLSWKERITRPWKDSYSLLKNRPDFAAFQWGFMGCGFGIMLVQPVIPLFAADVLGISHLEMMTAISMAQGLGFASSSPLWSKALERVPMLKLSAFVFLTVGLFPILIGLSTFSLIWFYIAYFWYGVGQGGSHLIWNLSGPSFSKDEESSRYTGVGVAMAGARGGVAPFLGSSIASFFGPVGALCLGGLCCFFSGFALLRKKGFAIQKAKI